MLAHQKDRFGGVIIDDTALPAEQAEFTAQLSVSLAAWREAGVRGVWLKVTTARTDLISVATAAGFSLHHAQDDYVMLTMWLPPTEGDGAVPNMLPEFATHYIGVGGLVINSRDEILLVEEKYQPPWLKARLAHLTTGPDGALPRLWKLPGGALSAGESIADGVTREVEEETGIKCRYVSTVAFRETLSYRHGKSDIYVVNKCVPLDETVPGALTIVPQAEEIADACWMPVAQFLEEVVWSEMNNAVVLFATTEHCSEFRRDLVPSSRDPSKPYPLFHGGPGMVELRQLLAAQKDGQSGGGGAGGGAIGNDSAGLGIAHMLLAFGAGAVLSHMLRGKL